MVEEEERRDAGCLMHRSTTRAGFSKKIPDDMTLSSDAAIVHGDCEQPTIERGSGGNGLARSIVGAPLQELPLRHVAVERSQHPHAGMLARTSRRRTSTEPLPPLPLP